MQRRQKNSDLLVDFMVGMSDGLVIPLAIVMGLSVVYSSFIVIITSLISSFIMAVALALSRYFSGRSVLHEERIHQIVSSLDVEQKTQEHIMEEATRTNSEWKEIIDELNDPSKLGKSAWNIGVSYFVAGFIPVMPLIFVADYGTAIKSSAILSLIALFVFGYAKGKLTGQNALVTAAKTMLIGIIAAITAYGVASLFA